MPREQQLTALAEANRVRLRRCHIKHQLHDGEITMLDALADPDAQRMALTELLAAQYRWGLPSALRLLEWLGMSSTLRVGDLSGKRRVHLADAVADRFGQSMFSGRRAA